MPIKTMFAGVLIPVALLASCAGRPEPGGRTADPASVDAAVEVGSLAPEFSLGSAEGTKVSLSEFRGTPVLLYFSMGPG